MLRLKSTIRNIVFVFYVPELLAMKTGRHADKTIILSNVQDYRKDRLEHGIARHESNIKYIMLHMQKGA